MRLVWFRGPVRIRTSFGTWTRLTVRHTEHGARSKEESAVLRASFTDSTLLGATLSMLQHSQQDSCYSTVSMPECPV